MDNEINEEWEEIAEIFRDNFNCNISANYLKINSDYICDNLQKILKIYDSLLNKDCKQEDFEHIINEIEKMKGEVIKAES